MITALAQVQTPVNESVARNVFDGVLSLFGSLDMLAQPDQLVRNLQMLSIVWAVVFLAVGLVLLISVNVELILRNLAEIVGARDLPPIPTGDGMDTGARGVD